MVRASAPRRAPSRRSLDGVRALVRDDRVSTRKSSRTCAARIRISRRPTGAGWCTRCAAHAHLLHARETATWTTPTDGHATSRDRPERRRGRCRAHRARAPLSRARSGRRRRPTSPRGPGSASATSSRRSTPRAAATLPRRARDASSTTSPRAASGGRRARAGPLPAEAATTSSSRFADRTRVISDEIPADGDRTAAGVSATFLVDGFVAGTWSGRGRPGDGSSRSRRCRGRRRRQVADEAKRLEAWLC